MDFSFKKWKAVHNVLQTFRYIGDAQMMKVLRKRTFTICGACGKECVKDFTSMKLAEPRDIWYDEEWQRYHIVCDLHSDIKVKN